MAVTDIQKVDYLWKKLGYGRAKTDQGTDALKPATSESIPSPLMLRADKVMTDASSIPASLPASSAGVVTVYPSATPLELPNPKVGSGTSARGYDDSGSTNRTWTTGLTDWIPPEFGSTYAVKVYIHTLGSVSTAVASGTELTAAGSGNSDEWFFDYQAGVLHFIGTNLPNGISFTGKSVYITGARYTGTFGVGSSIGDFTFTGNVISTSETDGNIQINPDGTGTVQVVGTNGLVIPTGTTAQRPGSASTGTIRFNTSTTSTEIWNGVEWVALDNEASVSVIDSLVGDNSTVTFNLSQATTTDGTLVSINGVIQTPTEAYSVTDDTITFVSAPTSSDNMIVRYLQNVMSVVLNALTVTGNITAGNVSATGIAGTLSTAAQTTITSVGTLGALAVTGNVTVGNVSATGNISASYFIGNGSLITGLVTSAANISEVGTLTSLAVTGNITSGNVAGTRGVFTNVAGTLETAAQTNITSVGTLTALAVTGNITAGNVSATGVAGTLSTAAQTSITSVGTLGSLAVTGNVTGGNLITAAAVNSATVVATGNITAGNVSATGIAGTLSTAAQTTITSVGTLGSLTVTNAVSLASITKSGTDGTGNIGQSDNAFNTIFGISTSAQYADVAENYLADAQYAPGTVITIGGNKEVTQTISYSDSAVLGIVSTNPGYLMNSNLKADGDACVVTVGVTGRLPCKVVGVIERGQLLVSSHVAGHACARNDGIYIPGSIVGKALEAKFDSLPGIIEVVMSKL